MSAESVRASHSLVDGPCSTAQVNVTAPPLCHSPKWMTLFSWNILQRFPLQEVSVSATWTIKVNSEEKLEQSQAKAKLETPMLRLLNVQMRGYVIANNSFRCHRSKALSAHEAANFSLIHILAKLFEPYSSI